MTFRCTKYIAGNFCGCKYSWKRKIKVFVGFNFHLTMATPTDNSKLQNGYGEF